MDNKQFTNDLTNLGFAANPLVLADDGRPTAAGDTAAVYSIALSNVAATTYTITALRCTGRVRVTPSVAT